MSYTADPAEITHRLEELASKVAARTEPLPGGAEGDWEAFVSAIAEARTQDGTGPANSLRRQAAVCGASLSRAWDLYWVPERRAERDRQVHAEWLARTVEIEEWRGTKFGSARRIPLAEAEWARAGHVLLEQRPDVRVPSDDGRDNLSLGGATVRTMAIGAEIAEGTVRAKRLVRRATGLVVQYLVKPRGKAAERRYQAARELAEIESQLRVSAEYLSAEQRQALHASADRLRAELA